MDRKLLSSMYYPSNSCSGTAIMRSTLSPKYDERKYSGSESRHTVHKTGVQTTDDKETVKPGTLDRRHPRGREKDKQGQTSPSKLRRRSILSLSASSNHGGHEIGSYTRNSLRQLASEHSPAIQCGEGIQIPTGLMEVPDLEAGCDSDDSMSDEAIPTRRTHKKPLPLTRSDSMKNSRQNNRHKLSKPRSEAVLRRFATRYFMRRPYKQSTGEYSEPARQRSSKATRVCDLALSSYHNIASDDSKSKVLLCSSKKFWIFFQFTIILVLGLYIFEIHNQKTKVHDKLQQFEDEQAHILSQMMWIDKAAKKITDSKRPPFEIQSPTDSEYEENPLEATIERLRKEVTSIESRIQQNARYNIESTYGTETPLRVKIQLKGQITGLRELVVELWDDNPHAAWTWLEQVQKAKWDGGSLTWKSQGILLASPGKKTNTSLEFLEKARRKNQDCEVSLLENEERKFTLSLNLLDDPSPDAADVCIGRVVEGLEKLQELPKSKHDLEGQQQIASVTVLHKQ